MSSAWEVLEATWQRRCIDCRRDISQGVRCTPCDRSHADRPPVAPAAPVVINGERQIVCPRCACETPAYDFLRLVGMKEAICRDCAESYAS